MAILTEANRTAEFLQSEANGYRSREVGTVDATGGALVAGAVLGRVDTAGASVAADGGNTGNGTFTLDVTDPVLTGAVAGDYVVTITEAALDGGQYTVEDPNGNVIGVANVGDTFADQIKFVLADGATDFVVGDTWTVTVAAGSGAYVAYDATATTGAEKAVAVLFEASTGAVSEDRTIVKRDAEVKHYKLTYTGTKATVVADLAEVGIIVRD